MRTKRINRCISICNTVILNPKYKHELRYVLEALEQELSQNRLRVEGLKIKSDKKEKN